MDSQVSNKKSKNLMLLIIGAVVLVAITVVVVLMLTKDKGETDQKKINEAILSRGFVEEDNAEQIVSAMEDKVAEGMFTCKMSTEWTFPDGTSEAKNAYIANSEKNRYTFYFDIYLEDEIIYSSPLVPVGSAIEGITLDKDLDAGEYALKVQYTMVDDAYEEVSSVGFMVSAKVKK